MSALETPIRNVMSCHFYWCVCPIETRVLFFSSLNVHILAKQYRDLWGFCSLPCFSLLVFLKFIVAVVFLKFIVAVDLFFYPKGTFWGIFFLQQFFFFQLTVWELFKRSVVYHTLFSPLQEFVKLIRMDQAMVVLGVISGRRPSENLTSSFSSPPVGRRRRRLDRVSGDFFWDN